MNKEDQKVHLRAFTERMASILLSKGDDYANADRLSNFKLAGSICGLSPAQNCLSLIATKVARLGVLLKADGKPNNESIQDTIIDLANYAALMDMIVGEGKLIIEVGDALKEKGNVDKTLYYGIVCKDFTDFAESIMALKLVDSPRHVTSHQFFTTTGTYVSIDTIDKVFSREYISIGETWNAYKNPEYDLIMKNLKETHPDQFVIKDPKLTSLK